MKNKTQKSKILLPPFERGQVWQLPDSHLRIGLVGRTLVHYKHYRGLGKTSPVLLSGKSALERFLQEHNAVLLQEPPLRTPATGRGRRPADLRTAFRPAEAKEN